VRCAQRPVPAPRPADRLDERRSPGTVGWEDAMNDAAIDPAVQLILRGLLSAVLAWAAWHKLRDVGAFRAAVEAYELVPPLWAVPVGAALIAAELGIAVGLWLPRVGTAAAL